ncbi:MAG: cysteine desulfurase [Acidimicrobiales bacterium]|nr:cysteine desulfurase [Acidimicrobiales bacterium]
MVHYLDHAASTPVHPRAVEAMTEVLTNSYGNPSGSHRLAREATIRLDAARSTIAQCFGLKPGNLVFTSGGTEADSLAVNGALQRTGPGSVAVCSAIEHHAILDPIIKTGGELVGVLPDGTLDLRHLRAVLNGLAEAQKPVALVSVMAANNESGVVQPVVEAATIVRQLAPDALVHTDAVQFPAWRSTVDLAEAVDMMSVSAHKFGGPKGTGFLSVRNDVTLPPHQLGGGQERGRRGGTQNVPGIVAMAAAVEVMIAERVDQAERISSLRDRMVARITSAISGVTITGGQAERLPNIAHLCVDGVESEALLFLLEKHDVMASAAASCSSGAQQTSHVLAAMGVPANSARGAIRLSLGYSSTQENVDAAADAVVAAVTRSRSHG